MTATCVDFVPTQYSNTQICVSAFLTRCPQMMINAYEDSNKTKINISSNYSILKNFSTCVFGLL